MKKDTRIFCSHQKDHGIGMLDEHLQEFKNGSSTPVGGNLPKTI